MPSILYRNEESMIDPYQYTIYICEYQKTWLKEIEGAKEMPEDWLPWRLSSKRGVKRASFIEVHEFFWVRD